MPYVIVEDFRVGYDKRRRPIAAVPGSLQKITNAHITRGGDIEKRKAFESHAVLPAGTFGLAAIGGTLYTFGSIAEPVGMPVEVTYQRLQHPDALAMATVRDWDVFQGKLYVIAEYSNGDVLHFYDGAIIGDWINGVVRSSFTDNNGIATELSSLINDADTEYALGVSATATTNVVTVTSDANIPFDTTSFVENVEGGTDDQTLTVATTQEAVEDLPEELASCSFQVIAGESDTGICEIQDIKINSVSIISATDIDWTGTNEFTAALIATAINNHTSSPDYNATDEGNTVIITAADGSGDTPNGFELEVTAGDKLITNIGSFEITGGTNSAGVNYVDNVSVDGNNIMSTNVDWATSNSATAAAVATQLRTDSSTYTAVAIGATVYVGKLVSTSGDPNNLTMAVSSGGDVTIGGSTAIYETQINTSCTVMNGGVDAVTGQPQISTLTVGGTFEVGDKFTITIDGTDIGATAVGGEKADAVITHQQKVYTVFGSTLAFSGVAEPTKWGINATGSGQIDMSTQASGSETLTALAVYQSELAVFARRAIQREFVEIDPDQNTQLQTINNFGTIAPKSVVSFGESDVFFLADNGIRSLRARDSSNTAAVSDIGTPIDPVIIDLLHTLTDAQIAAAIGVIEPEDGRYLLAISNKVYCFSFFPVSKISAWSEYELGFSVEDWAVADNRLYCRATVEAVDTVYIYGGADNETYDASTVRIELPYVDGRRNADFKQWTGYDIALEGEWTLSYSENPNDYVSEAVIGIVTEHSYHKARHGMQANSPYISLRFDHAKSEAARLTNMTLHYEGTHSQ